MQMGGPRSPDELAPFMRSLFSDPEMIRLPGPWSALQGPLGAVYGTWRAHRLRADYEAIGWSPLVDTLDEVGHALADRLEGSIATVELAMRYTPPRARSALEALDEQGLDHAIALPMYPFYSMATTGSSLADLREARTEVRPGLTIEPIHGWGTLEGHADLVAQRLEATLAEADGGERAVLLSAHGLPRAYVEHEKDPYRRQVETAAGKLADRFPEERVELAFQSDIGPVDWLRPSTPDTIHELADDGVEELVIVPFGFVAEHVETLEEIDQEYAELAREAGIERVHRAPTFGADSDLVDLLADVVQARLEAPA